LEVLTGLIAVFLRAIIDIHSNYTYLDINLRLIDFDSCSNLVDIRKVKCIDLQEKGMIYNADSIKSHMNDTQAEIGGKWVAARPLPFYGPYGIWLNIKGACMVLLGKADALVWYKQ